MTGDVPEPAKTRLLPCRFQPAYTLKLQEKNHALGRGSIMKKRFRLLLILLAVLALCAVSSILFMF